MTIKNYSRRDSATSALRKMGIKSDQYNKFIKTNDDGSVDCNISAAKKSLSGPVKSKGKVTKKRGKKAATSKAVRPINTETISGLCRSMILDGKDNESILKALKKKFGAKRFEDKSHYPAWYRCELRRAGELPPAFDPSKRNPNAEHRI